MENREFYIDHDGLKLHAKLDFPDHPQDQAKEKYPLVIVIHGFTGHMEERHICAVAKVLNDNGFATLRAEMYGHGQSDGAFRDHTLLKWMSEALTIIDYARGLDFVTDLYLCGHSQGGLLTVLAGAMKQDVLRAIIPLSPALMIPDMARKGEVLGVTFDPDHVPEVLAFPEGKELGGNYIRAAQMVWIDDAIRKFKKPVLIIHADTDEAVPVQCAYDAAEKYENVVLKIIPNDTHCYDNHLEMVTEAVAEFMKQFL